MIQTIKNLPEYYHDIPEIRELCNSLNEEFKQIAKDNDFDFNELFVLSASEDSIEKWEKEIYIKYDKFLDTLEFRKERIINRYTIKPPFTMRWLEQQLSAFLKDGFISLIRDEDIETLFINASLESLPKLREFRSTLENTVPLSMLWSMIFIAQRETTARLYFGSTNLMHIKIESKPD